MLASWREPWWKAVVVGTGLTLAFLAAGAWQMTVVAAAAAGLLSGRGRVGAVRGIQATAPAWVLWLLVLSVLSPVQQLVVVLGGILGPGWGLVLFLYVLIPIFLGLFGGMAGGYFAELLTKEPAAATIPSDAGPPAR